MPASLFQRDAARQHANPISFTQATAIVTLPFESPRFGRAYEIQGITFLSLSEHRDKYPAVAAGDIGIQGFTRGHRTSAGTIAFDVTSQTPWADVLRAFSYFRGQSIDIRHVGIDEVPEFDMTVVFTDDLTGDSRFVTIYGMSIVDGSKNIGVDSVKLTDVYTFIARRHTNVMSYEESNLVFETPRPRPPAPDSAVPVSIPEILQKVAYV